MNRRLFSSLGLSNLITVVTIVGQLVAVPIYLTRWGTQIYGEWLTLTNLVASLSILNLGVQSYVGNVLIACYVRGDLDEGTRVLHAALRLYTLLCGIAFAIALGLAALPGLPAWLNISVTPAPHVRLIVVVQGMISTYAILGGLLMNLFRVTGQLPRQLG